jgi:hypothetical protein
MNIFVMPSPRRPAPAQPTPSVPATPPEQAITPREPPPQLATLVRALARSAAGEAFAGRGWTPRSKQRGMVTLREHLIMMVLLAVIAAAAMFLTGAW